MTLCLICLNAILTYRSLVATLCDSRWDINAIDQLPDYMKICFLTLHKSVNEMALDTEKEQRFHIIEYLKKAVWNWLLYSSILILNIYFSWIPCVILPLIHLSTINLQWADLCRSYLLEAKWYYNKYTPSLQEYIENAWISISAPTILVHTYFFVTNPITKEALDCLEEYPNTIRWSAIILRLADDLGTSTVC